MEGQNWIKRKNEGGESVEKDEWVQGIWEGGNVGVMGHRRTKGSQYEAERSGWL